MINKLLWLALIINLAYVITGVAKYGSEHVDAYGIWMLKARGLVTEGGVPIKMLKDSTYLYSHQQYPLLLPALMAGWAEIFGKVESFVWVYPLLYVLVLAVIYRLTGDLGWTSAASFMGPLMAQGGRGHAGLADIWITLLLGLGLLAVKQKSWLGLILIVAVASQIKMEGIFLMALFWGMSGPWRKKFRWMILAGLPFLWWQWQIRAWGLPTDIGFAWPGIGGLIQRFFVIVGLVAQEMLNWRNWYIVWPIWWITLLSGFARFSPFKRENLKILGIMTAGYLAVYLLAKIEPAVYVGSSIDRVMLQLLPLWWPMLGWKNEPNGNQQTTIA